MKTRLAACAMAKNTSISEALRFHEGIHEIHDGGDAEDGRQQLEDDHSFSTTLAMKPTSANTASMPNTYNRSGTRLLGRDHARSIPNTATATAAAERLDTRSELPSPVLTAYTRRYAETLRNPYAAGGRPRLRTRG